MIDETNHTYFVTSDGDSPLQLFFDRESAMDVCAPYVDVFNQRGFRVGTYIWNKFLGEYEYEQ